MAENQLKTAISPRQPFSGQVRRIPGSATNICTWKVRSIYKEGKIHNVIQEMKRLKVDIMGISETRWPGKGQCNVSGCTVYYLGNVNQHPRNGVGVIVSNVMAKVVRMCLRFPVGLFCLSLMAIHSKLTSYKSTRQLRTRQTKRSMNFTIK